MLIALNTVARAEDTLRCLKIIRIRQILSIYARTIKSNWINSCVGGEAQFEFQRIIFHRFEAPYWN